MPKSAPQSASVPKPAPSNDGKTQNGTLFAPGALATASAPNANPLADLAKLEADLWEAADQLRANSKLTSSEYCMPVLGVIFLRHAANRFEAATKQIQDDQAAGRMPKRTPVQADYIKRRALFLPETARYDYILSQPKGADLSKAIIKAMTAIEDAFEPLAGVLPKEYGIFERSVLEDLLKIFNRDILKTASGDLFGRIYEYFLMKFAMEGAQDKGEFFTPPSIVQTIVNVIEPEHGVVFDPACGSAGMFVQSSHFIEGTLHQDTAKRVRFFGQEKTATTIKLAKMNLAVHGLEGNIREANTFYQDEHTLVGKCDFVMANPPFNVDMVDAEKVKTDTKRLPFGLPGVNKEKKVSNGNYLWISYFWSYLNEKGRAGFVMSSQASSAGHGEKDVRQKIIQTGDVDVMISIRNNFFYTRTVPCELWFFDRSRPAERKGTTLMLDARQVFRKVSRKVNDFSPEQLANLTAIVWLYREQHDRFLGLIRDYIALVAHECAQIGGAIDAFAAAQAALREPLDKFHKDISSLATVEQAKKNVFAAALKDLDDANVAATADAKEVLAAATAFAHAHTKSLPETNTKQHAARKVFDPTADRLKGLIKQIDHVYKLSCRAVDPAIDIAANEHAAEHYDRRHISRLIKDLEAVRKRVVEQLRTPAYFHKQVVWLQDRFPRAELATVPGLVRVVSTKEMESADWALSPGSYVGVAAPEVDDDFDFEQAMNDVHTELVDLDVEASRLASAIGRNFEELLG